MEIESAIKKSDLILVKGGAKVGKLTFSLFAIMNYLSNSSVMLFSPLSNPLLLKRLSAMKHLEDKRLLKTLDSLKTLSLKDDFKTLVEDYGSHLIIDDIKKSIKKNDINTLVFHRFELFFGIHQPREVNEFIQELVYLKDELGLKIFITYLTASNEQSFLDDVLESATDVSLFIKKELSHPVVEIKNSIFPVQPSVFSFNFQNNALSLLPSSPDGTFQSQGEVKQEQKVDKTILLATDDESLIKLNNYIFSKPNLTLEIASSMAEIVQKTLQEPDLIIYKSFSTKFDLEICRIIKKNNLKSKVMYLIEQDYVRFEDKIAASNAGCEEVLSRNFIFEEYILSIEKVLKNAFYTSLSYQLPENKIMQNNKQFCEVVDNLIEEKILFSIVKITTNIPKDEIVSQVRKKDIVFYENGQVVFCLVNLSKNMVKTFLEKITALALSSKGYELEFVETIDSLSWRERKEKVCG